MNFITVLVAILCFGIIIMIHEAGHFFVAKKCGIRVLEFSIGMGPAIFSVQRGETKYSLRLLPIGGYCAMDGEDEDSSDPRAFRKQAVWKRMLVTVAGATMNLILGFVLIVIVTCMDDAITSTIIADFPADENGVSLSSSGEKLRKDDRFVSINGLHIYTVTDITYALKNDDCDTYTVVVERGGELVTLNDVEFRNTKTGSMLDFYVYGLHKSFGNVAAYTCENFVTTARLIWISFFDLIRGKYGFHDLSGVVGIISSTTEYVAAEVSLHDKAMTLFELMSFITINVGIFNLIPLPALDGGRLVFLILEGIRRKPVPANIEGMVHFVGLAVLMLLMIAITFQDITKLVHK